MSNYNDDRGSKRSQNETRKSRSSKAELDRLFSSGKLGKYVKSKEEDLDIESTSDNALINKVKKALRITDHQKFLKEAEKIIEKEGTPKDFEFLGRALALQHYEHIVKVMETIKLMLEDDQTPDRSRAMKAQLKMLPFKFGDPVIDDLSQEIMQLL
jgi:hypothetical protein